MLLRATVGDDESQQRIAEQELLNAGATAIPVPVLCEFAWVPTRRYKYQRKDVADAIRQLIDDSRVQADRLAIETDLAVLESGGDFADGAIAHQGEQLGADVFLSFDAKAVRLLSAQGMAARLLSS